MKAGGESHEVSEVTRVICRKNYHLLPVSIDKSIIAADKLQRKTNIQAY